MRQVESSFRLYITHGLQKYNPILPIKFFLHYYILVLHMQQWINQTHVINHHHREEKEIQRSNKGQMACQHKKADDRVGEK